MKKGLLTMLFAAILMPFMMNAQESTSKYRVVDTTACNSFTWDVNGQTYTQSTTVAEHVGDSLIILNLTMGYSTTYTVPGNVMGGCTYTWGGTTYNTSGTKTQTFHTVIGGCDSVVTINLVLDTISTRSYQVTACAQYIWHEDTLTATNVYHKNIVEGDCDSILTLDLTILTPEQKSSDTVVVACDKINFRFSSGFPKTIQAIATDTVLTSEYFVLNGTVQDKSNWGSFHKRTVEQCFDSVRTATITINHSTYTNTTVTECNSYTFVNGEIERTYTSNTKDTITIGKNSDNCNDNVILTVNINKSPVVTINGDFEVNPNNGSTTLYATADQNNVTYAWTTEATHNVTGSKHDTIHVSGINGNTDVIAEATNNTTHCVGAGNVTILANVAIEDVEDARINIYPNPTTSLINIECGEAISSIVIYNTMGQRIMSVRESGNKSTLNLSSLAKGTYTMRIMMENGETITRNFVVSK